MAEMSPTTVPSRRPVSSGTPGGGLPDPVRGDAFPVEPAPGTSHTTPADGETTIMTARGVRHYPINDVCLNAARTRRALTAAEAAFLEHRDPLP